MIVHGEFTADDRVTLEIGARGIIIRYESYRQLGTVNYSVKGYEPFFEGEWLPIARYDNRKGTAQKEVVRPMPMAYSAMGLHFKDQWGQITAAELFDKAFEDIIANWQSYRSNYDVKFPDVSEDKAKQAQLNLELMKPLMAELVAKDAVRKEVVEGMSFTPMPKQNEWLLEVNSKAIGRIDKKALRGELKPMTIGEHRILTHEPHGPDGPAPMPEAGKPKGLFL